MADDGVPEETWELNEKDVTLSGKELGQGAYGKVFLADYLGTEVAVKRLGPEGKEDEEPLPPVYIKREISILKLCRHPNIVTFMGLIRHDKTAAPDDFSKVDIVTEFCSSGDLRTYLKKEVEISWRRRVTMSIDIAKAMIYLHSKNIIFRDLKCKNFLLDSHSRIKVCDFGFARSNTEKSRPKTICGTDGFLAPEVILGMEYDEKADVFSYGMVLFEIITRMRIDKAIQRGPADFFGVVEEKVKVSKIIPTDAPEGFVALAFWCTKYEPKDRPDFRKVLVALNKIIESIPQRKKARPVSAKPTTSAAVQAFITEVDAVRNTKSANALLDKPAPDKKTTPADKKARLEELKAKKAAKEDGKHAKEPKEPKETKEKDAGKDKTPASPSPPAPSLRGPSYSPSSSEIRNELPPIELSSMEAGTKVVKVANPKSPRRHVMSGSLFMGGPSPVANLPRDK